jgi:hypothetical protein
MGHCVRSETSVRFITGFFALETQMDMFLATDLQTHTTLRQTSNFPPLRFPTAAASNG